MDKTLNDNSHEIPSNPLDLATERRKIIDSVLSNGLRPSNELHTGLRSVDQSPSEWVFGRVIRPEWDTTRLQHTLYNTDVSPVAVTIERNGQSYEETISMINDLKRSKIIEARTFSSMIMIYNTDGVDDTGTKSKVDLSPEKIVAVLIPAEIHNQQPDLDTKIPIIKVDGIVERSILGENKIQVPDYERKLQELLLRTGQPLWVHAVRLPTQGDLDTS